MRRKDIIVGFIIGTVVSLLGTLLFTVYIGINLNLNLDETIKRGLSTKLLGKRASIGALLNLPVFYFFLNKRKDKIAQGILMSLLIVAFIFIVTL